VERDSPSVIQCCIPTEIAGVSLKINFHAFQIMACFTTNISILLFYIESDFGWFCHFGESQLKINTTNTRLKLRRRLDGRQYQ
jgi:hypothetical protein